ncbi:Polyketide synthase dehydratase, partial [Frankia sp. EI5c]|uniref:type I polyketide synthase n=1 Tax=Frankia sp. EI5c TaxID=683316 RepID=UPI0007C38785
YWTRHTRNTVRYHQATQTLTTLNTTLHLELGPHPTLTPHTPHTTPTLRTNHPEPHTLTTALATAHTHGFPVDWKELLPATAGRADLPTYRFQRRHFWFRAPRAWAREEDLGLLGTAVERADDGALLFTGALAPDRHPWLADHVIGGRPLVPGSLYVDLALRAGLRADTPVLDELTLHAPLPLPERGTLRLQVSVGAADEDGRRTLTVHSRPGDDGPWALHATGALRPEEIGGGNAEAAATAGEGPWPPADAEPLEVDDVYRRLRELGYDYGAGLRNVRAAWQDGESLLAEVHLGAGTDSERDPTAAGPAGTPAGAPAGTPEADAAGSGGEPFALHPALLDAALHLLPLRDISPLRDAGAGGGEHGPRVPFAWAGVRLAATGATAVRVRLVPTGDGSVSVLLSDLDGVPVASARSLALRAVPTTVAAAADDALFTLEWRPVTAAPTDPDRASASGSAADGVEVRRVAGGRPAEAVANEALTLVQNVLRDAAGAGQVTRLAVVTSAAVWTGTADPGIEPAVATAWGLLRSAMSEHPDRFLLVDTDGSPASERALTGALSFALSSGESQLALRGGQLLAPRLRRLATPPVSAPVSAPAPVTATATATQEGSGDEATREDQATRPEPGTVLITGATGALGGLIAERLVTRHGVRHLLLLSRRGPDAPGADTLLARLRDLGAEPRLVACDTADRESLAELLASIPAEHPLTDVVHAAGVLADGTVETLTPRHLTTTLTPKATAATNLHTLTHHHPLHTFLLFSSITATTGTPGQANYAAANAYLDALAHHRHTHHLPATSIAWGLWNPTPS